MAPCCHSPSPFIIKIMLRPSCFCYFCINVFQSISLIIVVFSNKPVFNRYIIYLYLLGWFLVFLQANQLRGQRSHNASHSSLSIYHLPKMQNARRYCRFPTACAQIKYGVNILFSGASGTGRGCRKIRNLLHAASPLSSIYAIIAYIHLPVKK